MNAERKLPLAGLPAVAWDRRRLAIHVQIGEVRLWSYVCDGAYAEPPVLATPPLDDLGSLSGVLADLGVDVARCFSCPVGYAPKTVSLRPDCILYVSARHRRLYAETDQTFDAYLGKFKKKAVSELMRQERRVAETNALRPPVQVFTAPDDMAGFHQTASAIARRSFQWRMLGTGLPADARSLEKMIETARKGRAYGFLLHIDDSPAAFHYFQRVEDGVLLFSATGYDQRHARYSPGTVLMLQVLRRATADPDIRLIDFDTGEFGYKAFFATRSVACADAYFFRKTPRNIGLLALKQGLSSTTRAGSFLLKKLQLHAAVKKLIRGAFTARGH
jgi:hypothetical protein